MNKTGLSTGILLVVVGLMMLVAPAQFVKVAVIVLGIASVVNGFINLVTVRTLIPDPYFRLDVAVRGWSSIIVGILAVALPLAFAETVWTVMVYILGIYLLLSAGMEIFAVIKLRSEHIATKLYVWEIAASVVIAVVLFIMPAAVGLAVVQIGGGLLVCAGAAVLVYTVRSRPIVVNPDSVEDSADSGHPEGKDADI
jgi:uncharacterized membrane protein HdeD (DUF308 family)